MLYDCLQYQSPSIIRRLSFASLEKFAVVSSPSHELKSKPNEIQPNSTTSRLTEASFELQRRITDSEFFERRLKNGEILLLTRVSL